jgi:predicted Zn-dependent protease
MPSIFGSALRFVAGAALAAVLGGCATGKIWLPAPKGDAEKSAPEPDRTSEGDKQIVARWGVIAKPELSGYVAGVGSKLAAVSNCPSMKWKFAVLDSPGPRAFSTEGGYVYINRGMIQLLRSENDLAAVLAHEIAHNCTWDARRGRTFDTLAVNGNLVAIGAIQPWALLTVFYFPEVVLLPAGAAIGSHHRQYEIDADRHGAEYLRRAGYPPESMAAAMEILRDLDAYEHDHPKPGRKYPRWMQRVYADHPAPDKRKAKLGHREAIPVADDSVFLAHLDGLEVGSTSVDGIAYGSKRYFVRLGLMIDLPKGWTARIDRDKLWLFGKDWRASMSMEQVGPDATGSLCDILRSIAYGTSLADVQEASGSGVRSCTARPDLPRALLVRQGGASRIGIVAREDDPGERYLFRGFGGIGAKSDLPFLSVARGIAAPGDDRPKTPALRIRNVREGDSFAALAKTARVPDAEATLRLLNQRYPSGELEVGQLVKVIE